MGILQLIAGIAFKEVSYQANKWHDDSMRKREEKRARKLEKKRLKELKDSQSPFDKYAQANDIRNFTDAQR